MNSYFLTKIDVIGLIDVIKTIPKIIDKILGTKYNRVRFGISHPGKKNLVDSYVLKKFNKKEEILLDNIINSLLKNFYLLLDNKKDLFLTNTSIEIKKIKEKYGL